MAGFDFFSQPQGPAIDVSLFPNAAKSGIAAGQNLPSTTSSIIQGITQGVQTGQQITAAQQQIEQRQNEIEQQPIQNALEEQKLKRLELENEIQELELKVARDDETSYLQLKRDKLKAEAFKASQVVEDIDNTKIIEALLDSPDLATRKSILTDPRLDGTLRRNEKTFEGVLGRLSANGDLTEQEKANAYEALNFSQTRQNAEAKARVQANYVDEIAKEQTKRINDVMDDGQLVDLMTKAGITDITEFGKRVETRSRSIGDPGNYDIYVDGKKLEGVPVLDESSNKTFAGWKHFLQVNKLVPAQQAQPRIEVADPRAAGEPDRPYSDALRGSARDTNEDVVEARRRKMAGDPTTRELMIEKKQLNQAGGIFGFTPDTSGGIAVPQRASPTPGPVTPPTGLFGFSTGAGGGIPAPAESAPSAAPTAAPAQSTQRGIPQAQPVSDTKKYPDVAFDTMPMTSKDVAETAMEGVPVTPEEIRKTQRPEQEQRTAALSLPEIKNVIDQTLPELRYAVEKGDKKATKFYPDKGVVRNVLRQSLLQNLDPLHQAIAAVESGGRMYAKNPDPDSTAEGFFQLTVAAAKDVKKNKGIPKENVEGGIEYINRLLDYYNGDVAPAVLAYRLGRGNVPKVSETKAIQIINAAADHAGTPASYGDLLTSLQYLKSKKQFSQSLVSLSDLAAYTSSILAYEKVFSAIQNRGKPVNAPRDTIVGRYRKNKYGMTPTDQWS